MRLCISAAMVVTFCRSRGVALDQETSKPSQAKPVTRVMTFAKQVHGAVTKLTREIAPIVKAVNDEVSESKHT